MNRAWILLLALLFGCDANATLDDDDDDVATDDDDAADDDDATDDDDAADDDDATPAPLYSGRCGDPVPDGATPAPPLPAYTGGTCPAFVPGTNNFQSSGVDRQFELVVPDGHDPTQPLPVLVMWHHLGGAADSLLNHGQIQDTANELGFMALVPEKTGDLSVGFGDYQFDPAWPYLSFATAEQIDQEAVFLDDMLACLAETYAVDENCVSSVGVSAGALWTSQLAHLRSERLASVVSLSGGVGPATGFNGIVDVRDWQPAARALPAMVLWGGPTDYLGVDFQIASQNLESELEDDGHFVLECVHNCGHGVPPVDPAVGLATLYGFALDHPYWQTAGTSIYEQDGLPEVLPEWCAIGAGNAAIRTGSCDPEDELGQ